MAITVLTEDQLFALALAFEAQAYPGKPTHEGSFLGQRARSFAQFGSAILAAVQDADNDGVPAYATADAAIRSRCTSEALDNWAVTYGLPSNRGAGLYGRNGATKATGGAGLVRGFPGSIQGALTGLRSNGVGVTLVNGVTIPPGGEISGAFQADEAGIAGNLPVGAILQFTSPAPGINPYVVLTTALSGGYDVESDLHLLERLIGHLRSPPKGGTARDYRVWAEESTDAQGGSLGIARAYVYPHRDGLGSEDIVVTLAGSGQGRGSAGATDAAARLLAVQAYLDSVRPVNDAPTAIWPYFDAARGLSIVVKAEPSAEYPWDWIGASLPATGFLGDRTKFSVLTDDLAPLGVNTPFYQAFVDGRKPRVQIQIPGQALPFVTQVVSGVGGGLSVAFTINPPLPTNLLGFDILPAGGAVMPTAIAVLNYVDSLGPSKQSRMYDRVTDEWEDRVTIGKLAWAALGAVDAVGKRVNVYSPRVGEGIGITVAVGVGAAAGLDVLTFDNWPPHTRGPELAWVASILILPV